MEKQKRGPKSQTLIMVPLSELVAKLPAGSNVKISRVWFQELQETLGLSPFSESATVVSATPETPEQISVTTLDLSDDQD
jgi:hypothetical protein